MTGLTAPLTPDAAVTGVPRRRRSRWRSPLVTLAIVWLGVVVVLALLGAALAPHPAGEQDLFVGLSGPSGGHLLGTDELGRDILSRVLVGTRSAVLGALGIALGATILSTMLGLIAGYVGGIAEATIMRGVDLMLALPALLVIIVVVGAFNGGYLVAVLVLALLTTPSATRMIRGVALEQRPRAYVEAARVMGLSSRRIMLSHVLPNVLPLVVVNLCLGFTFGLVSLAGLSFVGLGVNPGAPDWGRMLYENRDLLPVNPWAALAPAIVIMLTAAAANLVGDWAYERIEARGRAR